uniref:Uncharacterized protein n=1 Tax=Arundo donax TaxID=35708 RepID=A0A0A9A7D0_ARUDO
MEVLLAAYCTLRAESLKPNPNHGWTSKKDYRTNHS